MFHFLPNGSVEKVLSPRGEPFQICCRRFPVYILPLSPRNEKQMRKAAAWQSVSPELKAEGISGGRGMKSRTSFMQNRRGLWGRDACSWDTKAVRIIGAPCKLP